MNHNIMPSLQVLSDVHLEARPSNMRFDDILTPAADILALVGDIGSPLLPSFEAFFVWCVSRFKRVYFVHGNHELYNTSHIPATCMIAIMQQICERVGVVYLHNRVDVYCNVYFVGSTLWSEVPDIAESKVMSVMNDYKYIYTLHDTTATVQDTNAEFVKNKQFLETEIRRANKLGYRPVIFTHHAPSTQQTSHPKHHGSLVSTAFATDLYGSSSNIQLWVAGHTHFNYDHTNAGYRLISNQMGYGEPIAKYNRQLCLNIH